MITLLAIALLAVNLATFAAFGWDKAAALLARQTLRHKTRKQPFGAWLTLIVFVQVTGLIVAAAVWLRRG